MATKKPAPTRYRFSVPDEDVSVKTWIENQNNLSSSVRMLIKEAIKKHGQQDVTCLPVEQYEKRGRPSNAERAAKTRTTQKKAPVEPVAEQPPVVVPTTPAPMPAPPAPKPEPAAPLPPPKKRDPETSRLPEVNDDGDNPIDQIMSQLSIGK